MRQFKINIEEKDYEMIEALKTDLGFDSKKEVILYLIHRQAAGIEQYDDLIAAIRKVYPEELKLSIRSTERMLRLIMDILNTYLMQGNAPKVFIPTDVATHKLLSEAMVKDKERLAHFKQNADSKRARNAKNRGNGTKPGTGDES